MVPNPLQMRILKIKFDNADLWTQTCNEIDWTNIDRDSFLDDLNSEKRSKNLMIRAAICEGEKDIPYSKLCLNINEGGRVKAALKVRIDRVKLVYQKAYADVRLTDEQREYRRKKLWDYRQTDLEKWGET
jgi:hypothetical protein